MKTPPVASLIDVWSEVQQKNVPPLSFVVDSIFDVENIEAPTGLNVMFMQVV